MRMAAPSATSGVSRAQRGEVDLPLLRREIRADLDIRLFNAQEAERERIGGVDHRVDPAVGHRRIRGVLPRHHHIEADPVEDEIPDEHPRPAPEGGEQIDDHPEQLGKFQRLFGGLGLFLPRLGGLFPFGAALLGLLRQVDGEKEPAPGTLRAAPPCGRPP